MTNSSTRTILLTGYEPWDKFDFNPSGEIARALNGQELDGNITVRGEVLPVDCRKMPGVLFGLIEKYQPAAVVGLGLAFGDSGIRVERLGHNRINIRTPDNGGNVAIDEPAIEGAPAAYFSTFPASAIVASLLRQGIPAYTSDHAGGHCCNLMLFSALHYLASMPDLANRTIPCGFLHLPGVPSMVAQQIAQSRERTVPASMSLDVMQQAVKLALETVTG